MKEQKFENDMEKLLRKDAENIEIDHEFKKALKNKIMGKVQEEKVVHIEKKRKLNINIKRYLKIASSFVICAFLGTNIYPAITNTGLNISKVENEDKIIKEKPEEKNVFAVKEITKLAVIPQNEEKDIVTDEVKEETETEIASKENSDSDTSLKASEKENFSVEESNKKASTIDYAEDSVETGVGEEKEASVESVVEETTTKENKEVEAANKVEQGENAKEDNIKTDEIKESSIEENSHMNKEDSSFKNQGEEVTPNDVPVEEKEEEIPSEKSSEKVPSKNVDENNITQEMEDEDINNLLLEEAKNKRAATGKEQEEAEELTPKIEEVSEKNNINWGCYDSRNSKDGKSMVKAEKGKLYLVDIESGTNKVLEIVSNNNAVVHKPNFLSNNKIIYCKKEIEGIGKGCIYQYDISSGKEKYITDGINPMISKDGKKLAFELDGKILIKFLESNTVESIDQGKYPSWSENGEYLSYVKEELEYSTDDTGKNKINKKYSTIWIYNSSTKNKNSITSKEFITDDSNIQQWAEEVRGTQKGNKPELYGKYSYFESIWSNDNKSLFVVRKDNENNIFEFVKVDLK